jgi:hypothetical protein
MSNHAERQLAVIRTYDDLRCAIRAYCQHQNVTRQYLEHRAGLADGHSGKLLGPKAVRGFGRKSLTWILEALGLELVLQQRRDAAVSEMVPVHAAEDARADAPAPQDWRRNRGSAWGRRMAARRHLLMTAEQRRASARRAAQARWQRQSSNIP